VAIRLAGASCYCNASLDADEISFSIGETQTCCGILKLGARKGLKAIAKKAGIEGAELHRFRKTYADTLHEEGVSVNTIRIRLGRESLDVTLAYLKGIAWA